MADAPFDVVGVGNAIVDVISQSDENHLARLDLNKGTMTLIDDAQAEWLYSEMGCRGRNLRRIGSQYARRDRVAGRPGGLYRQGAGRSAR